SPSFPPRRASDLKARDYFLPAGTDKGKYISNRYGGTLGGPILRNKLFFFSSYGGRAERDNGNATFSVPSPAIRRGDFSGFNTVIYDPLTGSSDGADRIPMPNNLISANPINPISKKV